jgi:hypothetical protein
LHAPGKKIASTWFFLTFENVFTIATNSYQLCQLPVEEEINKLAGEKQPKKKGGNLQIMAIFRIA